jgi:hypothetical protein
MRADENPFVTSQSLVCPVAATAAPMVSHVNVSCEGSRRKSLIVLLKSPAND